MTKKEKSTRDFSFMEMTPKITFIGNCKHDIKENFLCNVPAHKKRRIF